MTLKSDIQTLEPGALVEMWELDGTEIGAGVTRFHGHNHAESIWFQGYEYLPWPIEAEGFARTSAATPQPTLTVSNFEGRITALCMAYQDMVGSILTRRRTLAQYLDAASFPLGPNLTPGGGTFDSDASIDGWFLSSGQALTSGGKLHVGLPPGGGTSAINFNVSTIAGRQYEISMAADVAGSAATFRVGTALNGSSLVANTVVNPGTSASMTFTGTGASVYVQVFRTSDALRAIVDDVVVRTAAGNPTADPTQEFQPEVWLVERKAYEDRDKVQFELSSAMDLEGQALPGRVILSARCLWLSIGGYRGEYCGYTGGAVAKADDTPTAVLAEDKCGGRVASCKLRFGADNPLPFGSFPAAGMMR